MFDFQIVTYKFPTVALNFWIQKNFKKQLFLTVLKCSILSLLDRLTIQKTRFSIKVRIWNSQLINHHQTEFLTFANLKTKVI